MMRYARKQGVETHHNLSYEVEIKALKMIGNYCEHIIINIGESCKPCIKCDKDFS